MAGFAMGELELEHSQAGLRLSLERNGIGVWGMTHGYPWTDPGVHRGRVSAHSCLHSMHDVTTLNSSDPQ